MPEVRPASGAPEPVRVALVEDDRRYRESLALLLGCAPDFEVTGRFATPRSFLDTLGEGGGGAEGGCGVGSPEGLSPDPWDLVLLDLDLPGMHGIECLRRLRARLPGVRVVILTVFEDRAVILDAICAGADGYLLKQTPAAELLEQVRGVLAGGAPLSSGVARTVLELVRDGRSGVGGASAPPGREAGVERGPGGREGGPGSREGGPGEGAPGPARGEPAFREGASVPGRDRSGHPGDLSAREERRTGAGPRHGGIEAGLTPRELDVLRGLVQGKSYKGVARSLDISLDTVRTHVRSVYRKLQVHSVAEAVSRALRDRMV